MKQKFGKNIKGGFFSTTKKYRNHHRINKSDRTRLFHATVKVIPIPPQQQDSLK